MEDSRKKLYSLENLEEISAGSTDFIRQMLEMFMEQAYKTVEGFREGIEIRNYQLIRDLAHQIKPSIDNLKMDQLAQLIREVESEAEKEAEEQNLNPLILETNSQLETVISQLKKEIEGM
ncbi:MAG: Hpt domain-containing protein [Cyclobacteriaceae bacterium]